MSRASCRAAGRRSTGAWSVRAGADSPWWQVDWVIAGSALLLSLLGSLLVWSATRPRLLDAGATRTPSCERHLLNLAIGLVLCCLFTVVDYRALRAYAPLIYLALPARPRRRAARRHARSTARTRGS